MTSELQTTVTDDFDAHVEALLQKHRQAALGQLDRLLAGTGRHHDQLLETFDTWLTAELRESVRCDASQCSRHRGHPGSHWGGAS